MINSCESYFFFVKTELMSYRFSLYIYVLYNRKTMNLQVYEIFLVFLDYSSLYPPIQCVLEYITNRTFMLIRPQTQIQSHFGSCRFTEQHIFSFIL